MPTTSSWYVFISLIGAQPHVAFGTGRWIRHGRGEGAVCDIRNHVSLAGKGRERTVRNTPRRRTHARAVQRPARRSVGALR